MADPGFGIPWPIVWGTGGGGGAGVPSISLTVIDTGTYSPHPVNCVIIETGPASELKKMQTDWFGPGGPSVETSTGIRRGNWFFKVPKSWTR